MIINNKEILIQEFANFGKYLTGYTDQDPDYNTGKFDERRRYLGSDYPTNFYTMIGVKRMINLQELLLDVIERDVPGDFLEAGVWRGGACIFAAHILKTLNIVDRSVWVCDSFEGLPKPDNQYIQDRGDRHHINKFLNVSLETVQDNFRKFDVLSDQVKFAKGWFKDTLHNIPAEKFSIIRLDGDMYSSTIESLTALYPRLSKGGFIIIDDYGLRPCAAAVHDYRSQHDITAQVEIIDGEASMAIYWQKPYN